MSWLRTGSTSRFTWATAVVAIVASVFIVAIPAADTNFPARIDFPLASTGAPWAGEGIFGRGNTFWAGDVVFGAIYKGDVRTGAVHTMRVVFVWSRW
jgi:hypothetical protein